MTESKQRHNVTGGVGGGGVEGDGLFLQGSEGKRGKKEGGRGKGKKVKLRDPSKCGKKFKCGHTQNAYITLKERQQINSTRGRK